MLKFFKGIYKSVNAFVAIAYLILGIYVLLPTTKLTIPTMYQLSLGVIIVTYGLFRFYRYYVNFLKTSRQQ